MNANTESFRILWPLWPALEAEEVTFLLYFYISNESRPIWNMWLTLAFGAILSLRLFTFHKCSLWSQKFLWNFLLAGIDQKILSSVVEFCHLVRSAETERWARTWKMKAVYIWKVPQRSPVLLVLLDKQKSLQRLPSGRAEWQKVGRLLHGDSSGVRDQQQRRRCDCRIQHITRLGRLRQIYSLAVGWLAPVVEIWVLIAALT